MAVQQCKGKRTEKEDNVELKEIRKIRTFKRLKGNPSDCYHFTTVLTLYIHDQMGS